jgi:Zn-dependent alcohol dehydrogenases
MRALCIDASAEQAVWTEVPMPDAGVGEVRIAIEAAGPKPARISLQSRGKYPGPC